MKKLALTSLLAVFAVSGAHAANVIDGNPLYMPKAGHFYSVSSLSSHTETTKDWALGEEFGYGITDKFAISVRTSLLENESFDEYGWEDFGVKAMFRVLDDGAWKADVYGEYAADGYLYAHSEDLKLVPSIGEDYAWFDKDLINYTWAAGVRGGYTTADFTIAGHLEYVYTTTESFKFGKDDHMLAHALKLGLDGQFVIDQNWNLVAGVEYTGYTDDEAFNKNSGVWSGMFGVNYNIDATKFVGAYVNATMDHWKGDAGELGAEKGWGFKDGFGFGLKFGIDF